MTSEQKWKEHLFFIHDQLACAREEDPPENAVVVFLAPVEVEIRTQVKIYAVVPSVFSCCALYSRAGPPW